MLIRMFEYDAQVALSHREIHDGVLDVFFPESGVLYVRESGKTPEKLKVRIHTSGTGAEYEVKVLRMRNYSAEELFEKRLYLLLPFLICNEEGHLHEYEIDAGSVMTFNERFANWVEQLNRAKEDRKLSDYGYATVVETMKAVSAYVTRKYPKVEREVSNIMGGKVIDYEARHIFNAGEASGFAKGEVKGESNGGLRMLCELVADGDLPLKTAVEKAKAYGVKDEEDFRKRALVLNIKIK